VIGLSHSQPFTNSCYYFKPTVESLPCEVLLTQGKQRIFCHKAKTIGWITQQFPVEQLCLMCAVWSCIVLKDYTSPHVNVSFCKAALPYIIIKACYIRHS